MRLFQKMATIAFAAVIFIGLGIQGAAAKDVDKENILFIKLKTGIVTIQMYPDVAPAHVQRIKELARQKFYDGLVFHRVIDGFMAQTGDPTGTGRSGSGQNIPAEFSNRPFKRGTVGMARSASHNSADSQFFICFEDSRFLDGKYTVWGEVIGGMQHVDQIKRGEPPRNPDKMLEVRVAADVIQNKPAPAAKAAE